MSNIHHPYDVWINHFPEIQDRYGRGKELSIKSLPDINNTIWGIQKKKLITIGGRPSQGKSALLLQIAWDLVTNNKKVIFFTFEMSKEDIIERLFCLDQEIDNFDLTTGKIGKYMGVRHYKIALEAFTKKIKDIQLVIVETVGKTFAEVNKLVKDLGYADCVIIDYVQMIKEKTTTKQAIDEYIKLLREYAIKKNFCILLSSQINRSTHLKGNIAIPEMHELKGTGSLEEHSDMVWIVHWPYKYTGEDKDKYKIWVCKNRNGRTIMKDCIFMPQYYKIKEKDEQNNDSTISRMDTNDTQRNLGY